MTDTEWGTLRDKVDKMEGVQPSAVATINGIAQAFRACSTDAGAVRKLADQLEAKAEVWAAGIANHPGQPTTIPPGFGTPKGGPGSVPPYTPAGTPPASPKGVPNPGQEAEDRERERVSHTEAGQETRGRDQAQRDRDQPQRDAAPPQRDNPNKDHRTR